MKTIQAVIAEIRDQFRAAGLDTPELDARLLVQEALQLSYEELIIRNQSNVSISECKKIENMVHRRMAREPVSRILGTRSFWRFNFNLSSETLDPRADSETLIDAVLRRADKSAKLSILDLGTGTGCLLLSLLQELPQAVGLGVDISPGAIATAQLNADRMGLSGQTRLIAADWKNMQINQTFDIIISNPPYIADAEIPLLEPEVRDYDPHRALSGGADGLNCYREIASLLPRLLAPGGMVFLEIGSTQAESVTDVLATHGFSVLQVVPDLAGHERCIVAGRA